MDRSRRERELRIIEELYEDGDPREVADRIGSEHPDLVNEIDAFQSTKKALDARPKRRPDRRALDAVFSEAVRPSTEIGRDRDRMRRPDRSAQSRRSTRLRSAGVLTAFLVAFIGVFSVWQSLLIDDQIPTQKSEEATAILEPSTSADRTDADTFGGEAESMADLLADDSDRASAETERPPAAPSASLDATLDLGVVDEQFSAAPSEIYDARVSSFSEAYSRGELTAGVAKLLPGDRQNGNTWFSWDEGADLIEVHQQIEMVRGSVTHGWDPPSMRLDLLPTFEQSDGAPPARLLPTAEPRVP